MAWSQHRPATCARAIRGPLSSSAARQGSHRLVYRPRAHDHDEKIARDSTPHRKGPQPTDARWRYSGPGSRYLLAQVVVALRALAQAQAAPSPHQTPPHILVHVRIARVLVRAFNSKAENAKSQHGGKELKLERGALVVGVILL